MYNNWSALDVALCLELALQKGGDALENVTATLRSLVEKTFRAEDEDLPVSLAAMAVMADPVDVTRRVVDNFYLAFRRAISIEEYKVEEPAADDELIEDSSDLAAAQAFNEHVVDEAVEAFQDQVCENFSQKIRTGDIGHTLEYTVDDSDPDKEMMTHQRASHRTMF